MSTSSLPLALILCCRNKSAKWATRPLTAFEAVARTPTVSPVFLFFEFLAFQLIDGCTAASSLSSLPTHLKARARKKMTRMITGMSDDTALFSVPAQSSVSNHRPKTNIQCFQESVGVLMTECGVQLTGSHHHRRVLQRLTGRRCKTVALVEDRPAARRGPRSSLSLCAGKQFARISFDVSNSASPLGLQGWTFLQNT